MEQNAGTTTPLLVVAHIFLLLMPSFYIPGTKASIGINYGTIADNLPPPAQVAQFLLKSTIINRVRLFDADSDIIRAFAHTGIAITVSVPNDQIPQLSKLIFAQQWVRAFIVPHIPATNIVRIIVGNEVISSSNKQWITDLVPAMQTLHAAVVAESLDRRIQISTSHSLAILASSSPPSSGKFHQGYAIHVLTPLLSFLKATESPFLINPYPFFGYSAETLDYALFKPNSGVVDEKTKLTYTNMLDGQLDAVFSALTSLNSSDIEIVIAETGWPSKGDAGQVGVDVENAAEYNSKLLKHVTSGVGTPLMPNKAFETYIFALFNEDLKPGPTSERNFGIFQPDMTPVYNLGILRPRAKESFPTYPAPEVPTATPKGKQWCLPKTGSKNEALQSNIDFVCGLGLDCRPIQEGGICYFPNTVPAHAAYAMNTYFQATGRNDFDCDFKGTGAIINIDPSYGKCKY